MKTVFGDLDEGKHTRLSDGNVAYGNYNPNNSKVKFNYNNSDYENDNFGFREEISRKRSYKAPFCVVLCVRKFIQLLISLPISTRDFESLKYALLLIISSSYSIRTRFCTTDCLTRADSRTFTFAVGGLKAASINSDNNSRVTPSTF